MIVPMKKVTIFVYEKEKDEALRKLRQLGALHIKNIKPPVAEDISVIEQKISNTEKLINYINTFEQLKPQKEAKNPEEIVDKFVELTQKRDSLLNELEELRTYIQWFEKWGKVSLDSIKELEKYGIYIHLYTVDKSYLKKIPADKNIFIVNQDKFNVYLALIGQNPEDRLELKEEIIPQVNPDDIYNRYNQLELELQKINKELADFTAYKEILEKYHAELLKNHEFNLVRYGMGSEERIAFLQGFCPTDNVPEISKNADKNGWGFIVEEPDDPSEVPTLIRNPKWIRIIDPVFKFMGTLPGYHETDISFWFLIFFSIFFALLIGDAGYGLTFLLATFLLRKKYKSAPSEPFTLFYLLSATTILWGSLSLTFFGYVIDVNKVVFIPKFIGKVNSYIRDNNNMMFITFLIGVIQLSLAHLINALRIINTLKAISEIGWIFIMWGLFFVAGGLVLNNPMPGFTVYLFLIGFILAGCFANPQKNILKGILSGIGNLPLSIISAFSDIVSYIRLFAVGLATVIVASSFNDMALGAGISNPIAGLISALILVFGHGLNILLGLMAVIVHGIRLNMLEFSGHLNMEWSGKPYKPFKE